MHLATVEMQVHVYLNVKLSKLLVVLGLVRVQISSAQNDHLMVQLIGVCVCVLVIPFNHNIS